MQIGIFDSGIGGLTVLKEAFKIIPSEDYLYYADTLNVPYGVKPKDEVRKHIFNAVHFMATKKIKALIIACNTATSVAAKELRETYDFPIIGMEPAVKPAVEKYGEEGKRVLVLATPLTLKEEKFQNLVAKVDCEQIIDVLPLPGLVEYAERLEFREEVILPYLKEKLSAYDIDQFGTIVLGCTHFPLYTSFFKKILSDNINVIDGNIGTVNHLKRVLEERGELKTGEKKGKITYFCSGKLVEDRVKLREYNKLIR